MSFFLITMRILYAFLGSLSELFDCSFLTCRRLEFNFNCLLGIYWQYRRVLHSSADMFTIVPSRAKKFLTSSHGICEANSELFVVKFDFLAIIYFLIDFFRFCGHRDESEWWIFPLALLLCKCIQLQLINWHVANLEIQDRSLYSKDFDLFWLSWYLSS